MTKRQMHQATTLQATDRQRSALDPRASVWIAANAGTGKTEVLTYRILALLLHNFALEPKAILGITFTNAAAAEMAARLTELLRDWSSFDDDTLQTQLQKVFGTTISREHLARFRQLPALVADSPPTLTTIHGFAQRVLGCMPAEGGLPQRFDLLDDAGYAVLLAEAQARAVREANEAEADALDTLLQELGDQGWRDLSNLLENNGRTVQEVLSTAGGVRNYFLKLQAELNLPPDFDPAQATQQMQPTADERAAWQQLKPDDDQTADGWLEYLFTNTGTPRKIGFPAAKKIADANPAAAATMLQAQQRVEALRENIRAAQTLTLTGALLVWWGAVNNQLSALKRERHLKTFADLLDDLEDHLQKAVEDTAQGQLLAQRLERQYAHLLLDEAQDNNAQQSRLVHLLARLFLSGAGGLGERTVLAVGDTKQSIYRFQGAQPRHFYDLKTMLQQWIGPNGTEHRLVTMESNFSFRSTPPLLQAVEDVFAAPEARTALGADWQPHQTVYPHEWGRVEVWPLTPVQKADDDTAFNVEAQPRLKADGPNAFARQLASWLTQQKQSPLVLPSTGKHLQWGDVLVLVQTNATAQAIAGGLSAAGVPAIAVGSKSTSVIPPLVSDILALLRYIGSPAHTLALAQVLKSPLCNVTDDQLLHLAQNNWQLPAGPLADWFAHWRTRAASVPPGIWLAELLHHPATLAAYAARGPLPAATLQGQAAGMIAAAQNHTSIAALLAAWELQPPPPAPAEANLVRVMTVHKAKGLGAPLVVLAETTYEPTLKKQKLAWHHNAESRPDLVLLRRKAEDSCKLQQQLDAAEKTRQSADQARGLYVALTRAKDWLIIGGWGEKAPEGSWYDAVQTAAQNWPQQNGIKVLEQGTRAQAPLAPATEISAPATLAPPPLQPIVWPEEEPYIPAREAALQRGNLQHRLLHALAPLPPQQRQSHGAQLLARWQASPDLLTPVLEVFRAHPHLFGPNSLGEVPVAVGSAEGRLDRLIEAPDHILIVDFKTEATPPAVLPPQYTAQLQGYAAALAPEYPQKPIRTALLWLATNTLVPVS